MCMSVFFIIFFVYRFELDRRSLNPIFNVPVWMWIIHMAHTELLFTKTKEMILTSLVPVLSDVTP